MTNDSKSSLGTQFLLAVLVLFAAWIVLKWVIRVVFCPPDSDESGDLTIFDFLEFQNDWQAGLGFGDYDGDGDLTIYDFLAYQNAFEQGCP